MISWHDLYTVLTAVVPLYAAMILAYGSVRWWRIFSPEQCAGINRFVAVFAVPLLSFHFISTNDPYSMNLRFIAADTLQKLLALAALAAWSHTPSGSLDRAVTAFSLASLPNTLVMGIPLLIAMYGPASGSLMVQIVVLQCILWYTLLLFLFEFRAARALVAHQFPDTAAHIVSFHVDPDVVSLADGDGEAEVGGDGRVRVTVRRSNVSRRSVAPNFVTPRPSNLTGAEIYSLSSSRNPSPRGSNFNHSDLFAMVAGPPPPPQHLRHSSFGAADLYSLQSSRHPSSFDEHADTNKAPTAATDAKDLHMFAWSAANSPPPPAGEAGGLHVFGDEEFAGASPPAAERDGAKEVRMPVHSDHPAANGSSAQIKGVDEGGVEGMPPASGGGVRAARKMPPASVMTRLILLMVWRKLIRNPNTYSSLIGLFWSLIAFRCHVSMPRIVEKSISILSDAGLGMAMFSLGLFMALQPRLIACGNKAAAVAMAVRFLAGPAVMAVASIAVGLRGDLLRVAIVQAALPQGIVPFVFAKEYDVHPAVLSTAVIFGMLIALPITLVYYIVLGL